MLAVPLAITKLQQDCSYGDKPPAFLAKVPSGLLPVIELDGQVITESADIMNVLDRVRCQPSLRSNKDVDMEIKAFACSVVTSASRRTRLLRLTRPCVLLADVLADARAGARCSSGRGSERHHAGGGGYTARPGMRRGRACDVAAASASSFSCLRFRPTAHSKAPAHLY